MKLVFFIWAIFCPVTLLTARKMKTLKKRKNFLEISSFNTSVPKIMIICLTVPEIWHMTDVTYFFILGYFLPFYSPNCPKNQNFKKWKKFLEILSFYTGVPKIVIRWCRVSEIWYMINGRTDGRTDDGGTDRRKRWHIGVGALSKKWRKKNILGGIIILYICTISENLMSIVFEIWSTIGRIFYFGSFFALLIP